MSLSRHHIYAPLMHSEVMFDWIRFTAYSLSQMIHKAFFRVVMTWVQWFILKLAFIFFFSVCPSQSRPCDPLEEVRRRAASQSRFADGGGSSAPVQCPVWRRWHLSVWGSELEGKGLPRCTRFCRRYGVCCMPCQPSSIQKCYREYAHLSNVSFKKSLSVVSYYILCSVHCVG